MKLLSLVVAAASLVVSTWRFQCPAQIAKVSFDLLPQLALMVHSHED
jgi:hypothetical protein